MTSTNPLYLPELREMLELQNIDEMREFLHALHPARTAEFMEGLSPNEIWQILQHAEMPLRVEIFGFFEEPTQVALIEQGDIDEMAAFIGELPSDDRVDMLNDVEPEILNELLPKIDADERRDIQRLRSYEEDTAGAVMTTEFARLNKEMTVQEAFEEIARQAAELETIYYLYVVDEQDHLRGLVSARKLVGAMVRPKTKIGDIMQVDLVTVNVHDDQEEVIRKVARYDLLAIPVVDDEHRLGGIITHDDALDVVIEEMEEDAYRRAGVQPLDETYLNTSVLTLSWKRGVWLTILFFGAQLTAILLDGFNWITISVPWLVAFIPVVTSTGGNSGNQAATLIITALSKGEVKLRDWFRIVKRELLVGLMLGGLLATCGFFCVLFIGPENMSASEMSVIPLTLLFVIVNGVILGAMLPLVFSRFGLDPALMSNPFVAGLSDVLGIIIYMKVAQLLLHLLHPDSVTVIETASHFIQAGLSMVA